MPSRITRILSGYQRALRESEERFTSLQGNLATNALTFYDSFFHRLVRNYHDSFNSPSELRRIKRLLTTHFGTDEIRFAAIDGTNFKESFNEYMVFFGASYGVKGTLSLQGDPPVVNYERWSSDEDVSFVSYIPIPFVELNEIGERQFTAHSDEEKTNLASIDTQLMQLAEVYLTYDFVSTSSLRPKLILMDHSMSSILMSNTGGIHDISMVGYEHSGRRLSKQDVVVILSHPYSNELNIPYPKKPQLYEFILKELYMNGPQSWANLSKKTPYTEEQVKHKVKGSYIFQQIDGEPAIVEETTDGLLQINGPYRDSWRWSKDLYKSICDRLFKEKDQSALRYSYVSDQGEQREGWVSPSDLKLLISIGIRALIEECWRHNVMLVGIVKDSASKYLTRNYLGVMREIGHYDFDSIGLPWTDRSFLEVLPLGDDEIKAPWSTIEFDASFMTLAYRQLRSDTTPHIQGVRGNIIAPPPRLFARSLGQFYINRSKPSILMGHVIFMDRLTNPSLDGSGFGHIEITDDQNQLGIIDPLLYSDSEQNNDAQDIMMFALHTLTRNLYPNVIGYPDPLHKADWGAKSVRNKIIPIIKTSGMNLRMRPLNRSLRDIRAGRGGR